LNAASSWPKPTAPTPLQLHLGLTVRTHDVGQFRQNFPDQFHQYFIDRLVQSLLFITEHLLSVFLLLYMRCL